MRRIIIILSISLNLFQDPFLFIFYLFYFTLTGMPVVHQVPRHGGLTIHPRKLSRAVSAHIPALRLRVRLRVLMDGRCRSHAIGGLQIGLDHSITREISLIDK